MSTIVEIMLAYFSESKQAGSYFLLFLVSIFMMWHINRQKNMWLTLYGILILIVAVMNPIMVWVISLVFPVMQSYAPITWIIPLMFYIPYVITELMDYVKTSRNRNLVIIIMIFLISISGSLCGFYHTKTYTDDAVVTKDEKEVVKFLNDQQTRLVLADPSLVPVISSYGELIPLMFGRDLWTMNLDTGIMDGYNEESYTLYDAMRTTKENIYFIADTAKACGCDYMAIKSFDDFKDKIGSYELVFNTDTYLVYRFCE